ncbi:recombinase RecT [[Clostridium] colinum]|uniref:recombinase RecT n=1 Tax=[Clostridium] colinum TaxID=36835 RepID=UPI002024A296|nr:recombinase RecT [[Clostridium] colinum]
MSNQVQKSKFSVAIQTTDIQKLMLDTLGDRKKVQSFITNISSAVIANPELQKCNAKSIIGAGLLGETLNLKTGVLGQYYLIPFDKKVKVPKETGGYEWKVVDSNAQFILGYKGYLQLAIRSGYYKKIVVTEIKEGELIKFNPLEEEIEVKLIEDFDKREQAKTIGYYGMFEFVNGFRKAIYWSKKQMETHADKHSQAFNLESLRKLENNQIPEKELYKYSSNWYKNFDEMGKKTILRQLFSKYGMLSTELQQAIEFEDSSINIENGSFLRETPENIPDAPEIIDDPTPTEIVNETEQINFDKL